MAPAAAPPPSAGLLLLSLADGSVRAVRALGEDPVAVALSPDGRRAYVSDNAPGIVRAVDLPSLRVLWETQVGGRPGPLLAAGEQVLVSLFEAGQVAALAAADGSPLARHPVGRGPGQLAVVAGAVLVACADGRLWGLDGTSRPAGAGFGLAAGPGGAWTADYADGRLVRAEDGLAVALPPGLHPFWLTAAGGGVLAAAEGDDEDRDAGAVLELDAGLRLQPRAAARDPDQVEAAGGRLFVAAHADRHVLVVESGSSRRWVWAPGAAPVAVAPDTALGLLLVVTDARE